MKRIRNAGRCLLAAAILSAAYTLWQCGDDVAAALFSGFDGVSIWNAAYWLGLIALTAALFTGRGRPIVIGAGLCAAYRLASILYFYVWLGWFVPLSVQGEAPGFWRDYGLLLLASGTLLLAYAVLAALTAASGRGARWPEKLWLLPGVLNFGGWAAYILLGQLIYGGLEFDSAGAFLTGFVLNALLPNLMSAASLALAGRWAGLTARDRRPGPA